MEPSWYCREVLCPLSLYSTALVPILLFIPELLVKILRSELSQAMSAMAFSLLGMMDILKLGFQCVW